MEFWKYHGTGNDFIVVDNRGGVFDANNIEKIKLLCHRRFGVGADGMLLLENSKEGAFMMVYINPDGSRGAMCGNGGRCIVHFAHHVLNIIPDPKKIMFEAVDGIHEASISANIVRLKLADVEKILERNGLPHLFSGTAPHVIQYVENVKNFPVVEEGRKIRWQDEVGTNVNFVEIQGEILNMRTYERGIEDETWACGTGASCAVVASHHLGKLKGNSASIRMPGGELKISFEENGGKYTNIWLEGPATLAFKGSLK